MRALVASIVSCLSSTAFATAQTPAPDPAPAPAPAIEWWMKDLDEGLAVAKDKPAGMALLYCWQDKHDVCSAMFGTLSHKDAVPLLVEFLCASAKKDEEAGAKVHQRFGVDTVPTVLFLDPQGATVDLMIGYVPLKEFVADVKRIRAGTDTIPDLRKKAAAAPQDLPLQLRLALKLRLAKDKNGAAPVIEAIVAKDPKSATEAGAEAMLLKLTDEVFAPGAAAKDGDTKALRIFLAKQKVKRIQFVGYDRLAAAEYKRGDLKAASDAALKAWKVVPPDQVRQFGWNLAAKTYLHWQELEKIDKDLLKQALAISERVVKEVEKELKESPDNAYMASALYLHASVLIVNNLRKEAFATMDKVIALAPNDAGLKAARDKWLDGSK